MSRIGKQELTSWKEIADHLQVAVRTAQMWEKERGLPVRRVPGKKRSRVSLRIDELEAWQRQSGLGEVRPRGKGSSVLLPLIYVGAAILGTMAANAYFWQPNSGRSDVRVPASWQVVDDTLIVRDQAGIEIWRKEFTEGLDAQAYAKPTSAPVFADLDGEGSLETLFIQKMDYSGPSDSLVCLSHTGEELWRYSVREAVSTQSDEFAGTYITARFVQATLANGRDIVVVANIHKPEYPTQIAVLSTDGKLLASYWHSGHIGHAEFGLAVADLDHDGRDEIYAAGVNNARDLATLVVLDPNQMLGASSEDNADYQLRGVSTRGEVARVFFPRSSMNQTVRFNIAASLQTGGNSISVAVRELLADPSNPEVLYDLAPDLSLLDVSFGDAFIVTHRALRQEGRVRLNLAEEEAMLRSKGLVVVRPSSASAGR